MTPRAAYAAVRRDHRGQPGHRRVLRRRRARQPGPGVRRRRGRRVRAGRLRRLGLLAADPGRRRCRAGRFVTEPAWPPGHRGRLRAVIAALAVWTLAGEARARLPAAWSCAGDARATPRPARPCTSTCWREAYGAARRPGAAARPSWPTPAAGPRAGGSGSPSGRPGCWPPHGDGAGRLRRRPGPAGDEDVAGARPSSTRSTSAPPGTAPGSARRCSTPSLGGRPAYLWVLEDNLRARRFYERNGFTPDGARKKFEPLDAWEVRLR